ncbi:MAG TPA: hypothetical protein VIT65_12835 [Microlunatus sp.]
MIEQTAHVEPGWFVEQEVVTRGDDQSTLLRNVVCSDDRQIQRPIEDGGRRQFPRPGHGACAGAQVTVGVEGVGGAFAITFAEASQELVREVEGVHLDDFRRGADGFGDDVCDCRLPGTGRAHESKDLSARFSCRRDGTLDEVYDGHVDTGDVFGRHAHFLQLFAQIVAHLVRTITRAHANGKRVLS